MASEKNITMRQFNGVDYDTLYPKTKAEQVEGIFSKEEIVNTETLSKYGLGADGTPNGVFDLLSRFNSGLGNEYVWEKKGTVYSQTIVEKDESTAVIGTSATLYYGDAFSISGSNFVIENPITISPTLTESAVQVLAGKYFTWQGNGTYSIMFRIPYGAEITVKNGGVYASSFEEYSNPVTTIETTYVNSPDPNAYPPTVSDGYTYTSLGRLGSKLKFEYGSYTGTGVGHSHSLTFGIQPELVFIQGKSGTGYLDGVTFFKGNDLWISLNYGGMTTIRISYNLGGNSLYIKTISDAVAEYILNASGNVYHYLAVGY